MTQHDFDEDLDEIVAEELEDEDFDETRHFGGSEFAAGILLGALVGAAVAVLFAPQAGSRTRRELGSRIRQLRDDTEDRWDDAKRDLKRQVTRRRKKAKKQLKRAADGARQVVTRLS